MLICTAFPTNARFADPIGAQRRRCLLMQSLSTLIPQRFSRRGRHRETLLSHNRGLVEARSAPRHLLRVRPPSPSDSDCCARRHPLEDLRLMRRPSWVPSLLLQIRCSRIRGRRARRTSDWKAALSPAEQCGGLELCRCRAAWKDIALLQDTCSPCFVRLAPASGMVRGVIDAGCGKAPVQRVGRRRSQVNASMVGALPHGRLGKQFFVCKDVWIVRAGGRVCVNERACLFMSVCLCMGGDYLETGVAGLRQWVRTWDVVGGLCCML